MAKEIEVKILNVNPVAIRKKLKTLRAKTVKKVFQRNLLYGNDFTTENHMVFRVREEGNSKSAIITVKANKRVVKGYKIADEYEMTVSDGKTIKKMIETLGFSQIGITEMRREYYSVKNCTVEIIELPRLPHYLELEGSQKDILIVAKLLGYSKSDFEARSIHKIFNIKRDKNKRYSLVFKK